MMLTTAYSRWILMDAPKVTPKVLLVFPKILKQENTCCDFFSAFSFIALSSNFGHVPTVYSPI